MVTVEPYRPIPGQVEVRVRENVRQITETEFEYDEYILHVKDRDGLKEDIEANMGDWLTTGRTLEFNESASAVVDMKDALEIMGVKV